MTDLRVFTILNVFNQAADAIWLGTPLTNAKGLEETRHYFRVL